MLQLSAPAYKIKTSVKLSGSKSISNRLLILCNVLDSPSSTLLNLSDSEDTAILIKALQQLKTSDPETIDIGHGGTDMRFLTALLATKKGSWILTGSERMKQRPILDLVTALRKLGAEINYIEKEGFPPLHIHGRSLSGGSVTMDGGVSSQFISALLLVSPLFKNGLELNITGIPVSQPYINMTVELLKQAGTRIDYSTDHIRVHPYNKNMSVSFKFIIESDWSSASYWYSICALSPGSEIELTTFNAQSLQADSVLPVLFERLGVKTVIKNQSLLLLASGNKTSEFVYDFTNSPDIAQTVATTCFALGIKATLTGLKTLKIKETNRVIALKNEIEKFGVSVQINEDSLIIPKNTIFGTSNTFTTKINIATYQDHRMAMSFAPLSLVCKYLNIEHPGVVNKSYPDFWKDLKNAGFNVNLQP